MKNFAKKMFLITSLNFFYNYLTDISVKCSNLNNDFCNETEILEVHSFELHQNSLSNIPTNIYHEIKPTGINLSNRNLAIIPPEIGLFKNLFYIDLSKNCIKNFCNLPNSLVYINLQVNNLRYLPKFFKNLINIENLLLDYNVFTVFPKVITNLKNLKILEFGHNNISKINSNIGQLTNLTFVNLEFNRINFISDSINKLQKLSLLILRGNKLESFPDNCENLFNLKILDLSLNLIFNIESICKIQSLEVLKIFGNDIREIPKDICKLTNLKSLELNCNKISDFPKTCKNLHELKILDLIHNNLKDITNIFNIKSLERLYLEHNRVSDIPINISNMENLDTLNLSNNYIFVLPKEVKKCLKLSDLDLSNNYLSNVEIICELKNLNRLVLNSNKISKIPNTIYNLKNLHVLDLSNNNIVNLPKELKNCSELISLELKFNKIKHIPIELFQMLSNLNFLNLEKNPLIYVNNSTDINILKLKIEMDDRLYIDDIGLVKIEEIYAELNKRAKRFNYVNLRKCRALILPTKILSEQELLQIILNFKANLDEKKFKENIKIVISDPNEFTNQVMSFDTTILIDYIHHLYNPHEEYPKCKVPDNMLDEFKKYIGAIITKLFNLNEIFSIEGHLINLSTAICYCVERQKAEITFLYELLFNENDMFFQKSENQELLNEPGSGQNLNNIQIYVENRIKRLIGAAKTKSVAKIFHIINNPQNVHVFNYWNYMLKDEIGLDVIGNKPELLGQDKFKGKLIFGLYAFFEEFTPDWLILDLKKNINCNGYLVCKIAEFLYLSDFKEKNKFVKCVNEDILSTYGVTTEFCKYILAKMEIVISD